MTAKQKAAAVAVFFAAITLATIIAAGIPGVRQWFGAAARLKKHSGIIFSPCAQEGFDIIRNGRLQTGLDRLAVCPPEEVEDPRLKIILADLDDSAKEFQAITRDWRPQLPSIFTGEDALNPQLNDEKIPLIDAFLKKHPDNYYAQLLIYEKALVHFSAGRFDECAGTLDASPELPAVQGYASYLRAFAAIKDGDFKTANRIASEFPKKHPNSYMAGEILLLQAYAYQLQGKPGQAIALAASVSISGSAPLVKWRGADLASNIYAQTAHPVMAVKTLAAAVADPNATIDADLAQLIQERGGPYLAGAFTAAELKAVGEYLIKNEDYYGALYLLKTAAGASPAPEINLLIARACVEAGRPCDPQDAITRLAAAAPGLKSTDDSAAACALRARALLIRNKPGDSKTAESSLKGCAANYPKKPGEAIEQLIKILDARGETSLADKYIETLIAADPAHSLDLAGRLARTRLLQRKRDTAYKAFAAIYNNFPAESYTPTAIYWMGRIALDKKDPAAAARIFSEIREKYPYSYYFFRAGDRLTEAGQSPGPDIPPSSSAFTASNSDLVRYGYSLMALGYQTTAESAFNQALLLGGSDADAASIALARLKLIQGDMPKSVRPLEKRIIKNQALYAAVINHPYHRELLFPVMYLDDIKKYSAANGVAPVMTLAVIRQESRFDRMATSRSNAKGLMQIMPSTGQWIAAKRGVANFTVDSLYDPATNIDSGTWYIKYLMKRFNGEIPLCVAAYNGGPGTVSRLIRASGFSDLDLFAESIPKFETRDYVKKVMHNYYVYSLLLKNR